MRATINATIEAGDAKNLLNVCDGRKMAKHPVYGQVQVVFDETGVRMVTCRDARTVAILDLHHGQFANASISILDGTTFLKDLMANGPDCTLEITNHIVKMTTPDGASSHLTEQTIQTLSFATLAKPPPTSYPNGFGWSTLAFESTDATLFGSMRTSKGKATTIKLTPHGQGMTISHFKIVDSEVYGVTCINSLHTEWNTNDEDG